MKRADFFKLTKLDLSTLARMGDSPGVIWVRYYRYANNAKAAAIADNHDCKGEPFKWGDTPKSESISSPDLRSHQYTLVAIKTEDR